MAVRFTPLSGAYDEAPLSYLLEVGEFRIMLDCGWSHRFDVATIEPMIRYFCFISLL